jgi:hypothetical protein
MGMAQDEEESPPGQPVTNNVHALQHRLGQPVGTLAWWNVLKWGEKEKCVVTKSIENGYVHFTSHKSGSHFFAEQQRKVTVPHFAHS